jgi:hypothetical protein
MMIQTTPMPAWKHPSKFAKSLRFPRLFRGSRGPAAAPRARRAARLALALPLLLPACGGAESPEVRSTGCPRCAEATPVGALPKGPIDECSGAVAGRAHPDVLYVHNDSGDDPRFFAIGLGGALRSEIEVARATAIDWEEVARGPCGAEGGDCLFFADIGDNDGERDGYAIYRVREPDTLDAAPRTELAEVISLSYPDGSHDAETLLVHPTTGAITVVTKVKKGSAGIYELPAPPAGAQSSAVLVAAGSIKAPAGSPSFTSGDVHPDGRGVLLRTSSHVFFYPMTPDQTVAQALAAPPCLLPVADEEQGEAIAWVPGGWDYVTISEGEKAPLHRVSCEAP